MAAPVITSEDVRIFMMDKAELNPLLAGIRFTPEMIDRAMVNVIDAYNTMLPPTATYTIEFFPFRYLLLIGVCGYLLKSASINEASNNFTYALDNVSVNDKDKAQIFLAMGQQFWEEFKETARNIKIAQNISSAYGGTGSEFGWNY